MTRIRITPKPKVTVTAEPAQEFDLNQFNKKQLKNYNDAKGGRAGTDFASAVATDIMAVNSRIDAIPQPADLSGYATKSELPALPNFSEFATHGAVSELLKDYVKTSQLPAPTDLSNYPTKSQVTEQINSAVASISGPSGGVTETKVNELVNTALSGYATTNYVNSAIAGINYPTVDLSLYAKKSELPKIPDLTQYTTTNDLAAAQSQVVNQIPDAAVTAVKQDIRMNPDGLMKTIIDAVLAKIPASGGGSSPYKEYEYRKVLRSSLKATGAGNGQEWHVTFKKPFSEPPFVNICQFRDSRLVSILMIYNITTTGFTFSSNYAGADTELAYEAYVPNS